MSDDANGGTSLFGRWRRKREHSGVEPFARLRYRGRERIISRIVSIVPGARTRGTLSPFEIFFGLG